MTLLELGMRFVGEIKEIPGGKNHPFIEWCHSTTTMGEQPDEVPWCSSFVNALAWMLRLPRSKSAAARGWLAIGQPVDFKSRTGNEIVVLSRGKGKALGHVGIYVGDHGEDNFTDEVEVLGGNQGNAVTIARFPADRVLGIRRLA